MSHDQKNLAYCPPVHYGLSTCAAVRSSWRSRTPLATAGADVSTAPHCPARNATCRGGHTRSPLQAGHAMASTPFAPLQTTPGRATKRRRSVSTGRTPGKRVIITEKPSMGRAVAAALGATTRRIGYLEGASDLVTWCVRTPGRTRRILARRDVERDEDVVAGLRAGLADGLEHDLERFAVRLQARREATLVADAGGRGRGSSGSIAARERSRRRGEALAKVGKPTGITMNSWKSTFESACAPPLRMFIIGTGSR